MKEQVEHKMKQQNIHITSQKILMSNGQVAEKTTV